MLTEISLNRETEKISVDKLTALIGDSDIKVLGFWNHTKATESYILLSICDTGECREWYVPYVYRRTNTFIETTAALVEYIKECKQFLNARRVEEFKKMMKKQTKQLFGAQSTVTLPIFRKLLKNCGKWLWNKEFTSSNPQRRIQFMKEIGFTLATKIEGKRTYHMLLPFDVVKAPTYETISSKARKIIFKVLENYDAYNDARVGRSALPDHKFPEIRWMADTADSNENLTEAEIRTKFQLIPEVANQTKREVCRECFQTGHRGKFFGINFFYSGDENWPLDIPIVGKEAESGCVGCFWYDMAVWRKALNERIEGSIK